MEFIRYSRWGRVAAALLCLLGTGRALGQVPLIDDAIAVEELATQSALEWRMAAARRALEAGLPGLAEASYRSLLEGGAPATELEASLRLGLAQALLGQGRYAAARAQLDLVPAAEASPRHALYKALAIFGEGGATVDEVGFKAALARASQGALSPEDQPWLAMAEGFAAELEGSQEVAIAAYERAAEATDLPLLQSHFEGLALRQRLFSAPGDEALAAELRAKINRFEGQAAYPFVREYAVLLYSLGRIGEAVGTIERELEKISAGYAAQEREQLRLLKGIILGADTESGRAALKELIRTGRNREAMGIALQLLARAPGQEVDLLEFLKVMISRTEPHPLLGEMYYLRSQLALRDPDMRSIAESDARILLEQFPGLSEITNVYRLLAYAALEKSPPQYRTAADFLIQLRDQSEAPEDLVGLNRLIGDCYFLNRDYDNAVDFYSAARSREVGLERDGDLFLRLVLALVRADSMEAALQLIDEVDFGGQVNLADRWRAEWNVAQALRASGDLERALMRVRLLLQNSLPSTVPVVLDFRLLWLEAKLSLEAGETEGLSERVAPILARLQSLPDEQSDRPDALTATARQLLKTEFLLLQASIFMQGEDSNAGIGLITQLRTSFPQSAAAQRSYLIEAAYHGLIGDYLAAQETLTRLAQTYPESSLAPQALFEAALYCERRGPEFFPEAVVLHNDLAELYPEDPLYYTARLKQGNLLRSMNDFAGAQIVYENLINGFPIYEMRYLAELSRADCMLALAGNEESALNDAVAALERLLDLPNLPLDFQAEASYKWAFALLKAEATAEAKEVLTLSVARFLLDGTQALELGRSGRYWVARSMLELGELLEGEDSPAEARRVYRKMIAYNLPGRHIAISRADRLLDVE